jgi:hypothetical protein
MANSTSAAVTPLRNHRLRDAVIIPAIASVYADRRAFDLRGVTRYAD